MQVTNGYGNKAPTGTDPGPFPVSQPVKFPPGKEDKAGMAEVAVNRAGTYRWLARLLASEINPKLLAFMVAHRGELSSLGLPDAEKEAEWLQARRVEYAQLFLMNVFPYEGIYTSPEVGLNTEVTEQVQESFHRAGFSQTVASEDVFADHLGVELEFMSFLAGQEARFWQIDPTQGEEVRALIISEQRFLQEHLTAWLSVFLLAVRLNGARGFYREIVEEIYSFVNQDLIYLGGILPLSEAGSEEREIDLAGREEPENLNRLVRYLITPVQAGFYLSKADIFSLARKLELPLGGADRFELLKSLIQSAGQYNQVESLLDSLAGLIKENYEGLAGLALDYGLETTPNPGQTWLKRLARSGQLLEKVKLNFSYNFEPAEG